MDNPHLILCGSALLSSRRREWTNAPTVPLRIGEPGGNLNLRITDITGKLRGNLKRRELDLIDIATYVYCADQATTRGGVKQIDYGHSWHRDFRFELPVRNPVFWSSPEVHDALATTLNDLSGDNFEFAFSKLKSPPPLDQYFEFGDSDDLAVDEVMLFSGGLDSFGGAVEQILEKRRRVVLVSHRPVSKIHSRQRELVDAINKRLPPKIRPPIHVPVLINKADKTLNKEYTQRTRSFLYASIAAVVARLFKLDGIHFYENGVTSLNLPINSQIVGTRATRTTHPKVFDGFKRVFAQVFGVPFDVSNPYFWKTKTDILKDIKASGHADLCGKTTSCAHTWQMTADKPHCGTCSQCVDRRMAVLAAGFSETDDPNSGYGVDVLRGSREGVDRILVESFAEIINRIEGFDTATQFCVAFPELSRVINHLPGRADDVAQKIFEMYKRHATQVAGALDAAGRAAISEMRRGSLAQNCLLTIVFPGTRKLADDEQRMVEPETGTPEQVATYVNGDIGNQLILDEELFAIRWCGKPPVRIGNKLEFRLLYALARKPNKFQRFTSLTQAIGRDAYDELAPVKSRLVSFLRSNGLKEVAAMIKTTKGHYGLFLS